MAFSLRELLKYSDIVIQCHDNPDADALASGYALWWYLNRKARDILETAGGKRKMSVRFVYGGEFPLHKSNLVLMRDILEIPVEHVRQINKPQLLITVDCQYGESNVTRFEGETIAVIDHHQVTGNLPQMAEVRTNYGSCSALMAELLYAEGMDINDDEKLATALYYGLMTDTNGFAEISHPADRDLRDRAKFNKAEITLFKNSNISVDELKIAGEALMNAVYTKKNKYAIVETKPCDPNILGLISDMILEVDTITTCLVYNILPPGVKISVRSCVPEVKASELAGFLAEGFGGGGGHTVKAGGFLKKDLLEMAGYKYSGEDIKKFLTDRYDDYFENCDIVHEEDYENGYYSKNAGAFGKYVKNNIKVGYVKTSDIAKTGTNVTIRSIEGDIELKTSKDSYIIVGIAGEIYSCSKEKFGKSFMLRNDGYEYPGEYSPMVVNSVTGERKELLPYVHPCTEIGGTSVIAGCLPQRMKLFTASDRDNYQLGMPGDYMVQTAEGLNIVRRDVFKRMYSLKD